MPAARALTLHVGRLSAIDHTSAARLNDWLHRRRATGMRIDLAGEKGRLRGLAA